MEKVHMDIDEGLCKATMALSQIRVVFYITQIMYIHYGKVSWNIIGIN